MVKKALWFPLPLSGAGAIALLAVGYSPCRSNNQPVPGIAGREFKRIEIPLRTNGRRRPGSRRGPTEEDLPIPRKRLHVFEGAKHEVLFRFDEAEYGKQTDRFMEDAGGGAGEGEP